MALTSLIAVAAVDAIRGREAEEEVAPASTELANRVAIADQLSALGAQGAVVIYEGCLVERLELPSLERTDNAGSV